MHLGPFWKGALANSRPGDADSGGSEVEAVDPEGHPLAILNYSSRIRRPYFGASAVPTNAIVKGGNPRAAHTEFAPSLSMRSAADLAAISSRASTVI